MTRQSLHPNHAHLVSYKLCNFYFQDGQQIFVDDEAYMTKAFWAGKERLKVWRYILLDHYSGYIVVRYYQHPADNDTSLGEFLCFAWGRRADRPFRGMPRLLVCDARSTVTRSPLQGALKALGVDVELVNDLGTAVEGWATPVDYDARTESRQQTWLQIQPGQLRELPKGACSLLKR